MEGEYKKITSWTVQPHNFFLTKRRAKKMTLIQNERFIFAIV